jgi:hypothetical protein
MLLRGRVGVGSGIDREMKNQKLKMPLIFASFVPVHCKNQRSYTG